MAKLNDNYRGFTAIEGILVGAVIILIGVIGSMVYTSHKQVTPVATPQLVKLNVEPKNSLGLTSTDKKAIVASILANCQKSDPTISFKVLGIENLDDAKLTRVKGNFVVSDLYCYINGTPESEQGSGRDYLLKRHGKSWTVLSASQMGPACSQLDGNGIPAGFITCYGDDNQPRDPR